ncbi:MAG: hypothetical protein M3Z23_13930 [Acidobacteriota bacterium]|nr:hypothetical protein [Acidobacteriota bacterium]
MKIGIACICLAGLSGANAATVGSCAIFPDTNVWNTAIDTIPVSSQSGAYVAAIGAGKPLHPDFGTHGSGIPFVIVPGSQTKVRVDFDYADESDNTLYPVPSDAPVEGGASSSGDRHVLMVDADSCILYELYSAYPNGDGTWKAGSGAIFDLQDNALRPARWTSADAAGLPVLPGLVRYDEVAAGEIRHALRFTAPRTQRAYVWPARHFASQLTDLQYPPMGQRFRLKADFDISGFPAEAQVVLVALKKYGMMLADNGSAWFVSGAPDDRWNDDTLHSLTLVKGSDFEAVEESALQLIPNGARVAESSRERLF